MEKKYRYLGGYTPRKDARNIVDGSAIFLDDYEGHKNMLHAKFLTSPYAHARIKKIDTSKAEALPGVRAVVTHWNLPDFAKSWRRGNPPTKELLGEEVLYVGDCVALVAADTLDIAKEAVRLIDVEYEVLKSVLDFDEALAPGAPALYPDDEVYDGNKLDFVNHCPVEFGEEMMVKVKRGNVEKAFEECDFIGGGECLFESFPAPLAPEPPGVICTYDYINDKYITNSTSQMPKTKAVELRLVPPTTIFEGKNFNVGGSYGNKQAMTSITFCTAILSRLTKHPVKYMMTKEEQFTIHEMRIGSRMNMRFGMKNGVVHAVQGTWTVTPGISNLAATCIIGVGLGEMQLALGKCENWDVITDVVVTNRIPSGVVRGYGGQELKSSMMPLVADAMRLSNIDPVDFYLNNFVGLGDKYIWRDSKWYTSRTDYKKCIKETAEKFGWAKRWKGWLTPTEKRGNKLVGVGCSLHGNADVGEDNSECIVSLKWNGLAIVHSQINESGMGQRSAVCKMAAEELNMEYEKVVISDNNSMDNPDDFGLMGSRGTLTCGSAVQRAAEDAKRQLFEMAAPLFHCSPSELENENSFVYLKEQPEIRMHWMEILGPNTSIVGVGRWKANYSQPNFCINFVEVEVDPDTGEVKLTDLVSGTDAGQVIDCKALEMQLQGGIGAAAIDTGVFEETILDKYTGRVLSNNLIDYKWRPFNEFPPFDDVILESQPNISKFRAVGVGEISGAAGAAAIAMAISNAIGKDYHDYPATPDRVLKALGKA